MYLKNNKPDIASVISALASSIREFSDQVDLYLDQAGEYEVLNPFKQSVLKVPAKADQSVRNSFWERLGIRQIISNSSQGPLEIQDHWHIETGKENRTPYKWNGLKNSAIIEGLRGLVGNSPVIRFADWTKAYDATGFWDGLFSDVIKPLNKRDFEFIFQLGDITRKHVFEVDEILDIMGDYSSYGRVTLTLDENEAGRSWNQLNGLSPDAAVSYCRSQGTKEKYLFLFNTMSIDVLLIFDENRTVLFSRDWQFEFSGRPLNTYYRNCFNAGYQLGLLLHFEILNCVALGLALSGACTENVSRPGSTVLLEYINDWITELRPDDSQKTEFLNFSL